MSTIFTTTIPETDCIGDSLDTINNNFDNLGTAVATVSSTINAFNVVDSPTIDLNFNNTTRSLSGSVIAGSVGTVQLSSGAVTTNKIALSAVTADRINLVTSLSSNGYQIMPGGLIMQWGTSGSLAGDGNQTLNFPIAFPNTCLRAFASITNSSTTNDDAFGRVLTYSNTQITVRAEFVGLASGTRFVEYLAIGF